MKKNRLIALLCSVSMCLSVDSYLPVEHYYKSDRGLSVSAETIISDDYSFEESEDGTLSIFEYKGNDINVVIPSEINGQKITRIAYGAFSGNTLIKTITIPDSVENIDDFAFAECSSLESMILPATIAEIDMSSFYNCSSLLSLRIDNPECMIMDSERFQQNIVISGYTGSTAEEFADNNDYEFLSIGITNNNFLISDTPIGSLTISGLTRETKNVIIPPMINDKEVSDIADNAFQNCEKIVSISLPDTISSIGWDAFSGCSSLQKINIPEKVSYIGANAFSQCRSLESINIPDGIEYIDGRTFEVCESLESITLPASVSRIGDSAFAGCTSLTSINIPEIITEIEDNTFRECNSLTSINLPDSITRIGNEAFYDCISLNSINIPNAVTIIGDSAFRGTAVTSIAIPDSVTSIGEGAFSDCEKLSSPIDIPDSVSNIGVSAFAYCSLLPAITINNPKCIIGDKAIPKETIIHGFTGSTAEEYADKFGNDFVSIGVLDDPVYTTTSSTSTTITTTKATTTTATTFKNTTTTSIITTSKSTNATTYTTTSYNTTKLTTALTSSNTTTTEITGANTISASGKCGKNVSWNLSSGTLTISGSGKMVDWQSSGVVPWNVYLKEIYNVRIESGVTNIGRVAFYDAVNLSSVSIPSTVETISAYAFTNSGISYVTIPDSVEMIGIDAFKNCDKLNEIKIFNSNCEIYGDGNSISRTATIYAPIGSKAEEYAVEYNHSYSLLNGSTYPQQTSATTSKMTTTAAKTNSTTLTTSKNTTTTRSSTRITTTKNTYPIYTMLTEIVTTNPWYDPWTTTTTATTTTTSTTTTTTTTIVVQNAYVKLESTIGSYYNNDTDFDKSQIKDAILYIVYNNGINTYNKTIGITKKIGFGTATPSNTFIDGKDDDYMYQIPLVVEGGNITDSDGRVILSNNSIIKDKDDQPITVLAYIRNIGKTSSTTVLTNTSTTRTSLITTSYSRTTTATKTNSTPLTTSQNTTTTRSSTRITTTKNTYPIYTTLTEIVTTNPWYDPWTTTTTTTTTTTSTTTTTTENDDVFDTPPISYRHF